MSYILDALKKAESERERGVVPGLSSTQTSYSTYISYGGSHKPWWLVLLALGLLVALVLGVWAWRQPAGAVVAAPVAPVVAAAPFTPAPKASEPVARSTVVPVMAKAAPAPASQALPAPAALPTAEPVAKAAPVSPVASPGPVRAASGAIPLLNELPEALRRQIPALNISGAIYSDAPPEWTLIINDQVMNRGSQVAPELRLEDISATSAVFNFRGQRFRVDR